MEVPGIEPTTLWLDVRHADLSAIEAVSRFNHTDYIRLAEVDGFSVRKSSEHNSSGRDFIIIVISFCIMVIIIIQWRIWTLWLSAISLESSSLLRGRTLPRLSYAWYFTKKFGTVRLPILKTSRINLFYNCECFLNWMHLGFVTWCQVYLDFPPISSCLIMDRSHLHITDVILWFRYESEL